MSTTATIARGSTTRAGGRRGRRGWPALWLLAVLVAGAVTVVQTEPAARRLVLPVAVMASLAVLHVTVLWRRDGEVPVFEIGTLWMASALLYSAVPFVNFVMNGLQWASNADGRLMGYPFDLDAVAAFAWRYVVYLGSFVVVYLPVRARATAAGAPLDPVPRSWIVGLVTLLALQWAFERLVYVVYGVTLHYAYSDIAAMSQVPEMPYVLLQVTFIVLAGALVIKQGLLLLLIRRWGDLRWRLLLVTWLGFEVVSVVMQMGARGGAVRLLLSLAVLYHRFVRPWRPFWLVVAGSVFLVAFLAQGVLRFRQDVDGGALLAGTNEFQAVFATAYDLYRRQLDGTLPPIPWQIYVSELYLFIPSQLLPFQKWDPADWYLEVIGIRGIGVGFMFGVMSQAVIGLDWIELAGRGALLGLVLALFHRWYVRRARRFWPTLLYLFVVIWSYYTMRATTFYLVHYVLYQFVPVMALTMLVSLAWRRRRARPSAAQPRTASIDLRTP